MFVPQSSDSTQKRKMVEERWNSLFSESLWKGYGRHRVGGERDVTLYGWSKTVMQAGNEISFLLFDDIAK